MATSGIDTCPIQALNAFNGFIKAFEGLMIYINGRRGLIKVMKDLSKDMEVLSRSLNSKLPV